MILYVKIHPKIDDDINHFIKFFVWISLYQICSNKYKEGTSHIPNNKNYGSS